MRIFLSYGHDSNEELVCLIKADLEKRGHDVWFDKSEIKGGRDWRRSITEGIIDSDRVLAFLSKHSTRDPGVCLDEIAIAIGVRGGNIQTILVESEQEVKPPPSVSYIQWLDMHAWKEQRAAGEAVWEKWYQEKLAEIVVVIESDQSRRFAGEIRTLEEHLKPISSYSRISQLLEKPMVGRVWLLDALEEWRNAADRTSRLFWIMGAPGVGKSAFVAHLAYYSRDKVIAVQFCEYDKPNHRNAHRIVRTLAFQIATRLPDYRTLLLKLPEITELDQKNPSELFDYILADPLRHAIDGGRARYLVIIDALDEAGGNGRNELVEMLARNAPGLPKWIGIVVTSRSEFDVTTALQALKPFPLDTKTEANRVDIRNYLRRELESHLEKRTDADRLVEHILEKSEGVFLFVERFCDDVHSGHLSLDRPDQFPQGLGGIFFQYFQRQFPDLEKFREEVRPALRAILAAREPLPVEILQCLSNWQDEKLRDFTHTLGSLFPVTTEHGNEVIKPYHKAIADWLSDERKAGSYFVSEMEGHRMLADLGCRELTRGSAAVAPDQPMSGPLADYTIRHTAEHCFALGYPAKDFRLLFKVFTPEYLIKLAAKGRSSQAFADNTCCLQALAEQERAANPMRRFAHALLACLLQDIAEESYRTGAYILDRAESRDYSAANSPLTVRAGIKLLLAEAAVDAGETVTAQKLVDEACRLSLSCWEGVDIGSLQAEAGTNLPHDSPLIVNLLRHPLAAYLARLAAELPEAAFQIANRVRPKRAELPNLATLWLAVMDRVPAEANDSGMERFFTFTDQHIADLCETVADYREVMDRYLLSLFRNKDRFSSAFVADVVVKCGQVLLTHLRDSFGEEWTFVRLLRSLAQLVTPQSSLPERIAVYRETSVNALALLEGAIFQEGKEVPIKVLAYYLRLRFECGLSIDQDLLQGAATYAFGGLVQERVHPLRFVEPIRVLYPISPEVLERIASERDFRLVLQEEISAVETSETKAGDSDTTKQITMTLTSNPNAPGLAAAMTTGPSARDWSATAMRRSRGMVDSKTILIVDPLVPTNESEVDHQATNPFEWNRRILALLRRGAALPQIQSEIERSGKAKWREFWRDNLRYFLVDLLIRAASRLGEDARMMLEQVWQSPYAADLGLREKATFDGFVAFGEAQSGRPLSDEQFVCLRSKAESLIAVDEDYSITMLAWAALQRPEEVLEVVDNFESREQQWLFWLILFRKCKSIPDALRGTGVNWLLRLSSEVASEKEFLLGMTTLLFLEPTPDWEKVRLALDTAYGLFPRKSRVSQRLCRSLIQTPEVREHARYAEVLRDHLQRIPAHWFDGDTSNGGDREGLAKALREITTDFVYHSMWLNALAPTFCDIVKTNDPEGEWHAARAVLFPEDFALNVQLLASKIERERNWSNAFPEELRGTLGGFFDAFARAVSPNKDPMGLHLAESFCELTFLISRSTDPSTKALLEKLLMAVPPSAVPTIAVEVISSALTRNDLQTAKEWLQRAGGLLRSEIEIWKSLLPDTEEGIKLVMNMLSIDAAPPIINNSVWLFVSACLERDREELDQFVEECLTLFCIVR